MFAKQPWSWVMAKMHEHCDSSCDDKNEATSNSFRSTTSTVPIATLHSSPTSNVTICLRSGSMSITAFVAESPKVQLHGSKKASGSTMAHSRVSGVTQCGGKHQFLPT